MACSSASSIPRSNKESLEECMCSICLCILIHPVTLPCGHELCRPCFKHTVEEASLTCPLCRTRISTWARRASKTNSIVDQKRWEQIQRLFPEKVQRRLDGYDDETDEEIVEKEDVYTSYRNMVQLSKPGEIRQEYEAELEKLAAEKEAERREEEAASQALIQSLQGREEAELTKAQRTQQQIAAGDEQLAQELAKLLNQAESDSESPINRLLKESQKNYPSSVPCPRSLSSTPTVSLKDSTPDRGKQALAKKNKTLETFFRRLPEGARTAKRSSSEPVHSLRKPAQASVPSRPPSAPVSNKENLPDLSGAERESFWSTVGEQGGESVSDIEGDEHVISVGESASEQAQSPHTGTGRCLGVRESDSVVTIASSDSGSMVICDGGSENTSVTVVGEEGPEFAPLRPGQRTPSVMSASTVPLDPCFVRITPRNLFSTKTLSSTTFPIINPDKAKVKPDRGKVIPVKVSSGQCASPIKNLGKEFEAERPTAQNEYLTRKARSSSDSSELEPSLFPAQVQQGEPSGQIKVPCPALPECLHQIEEETRRVQYSRTTLKEFRRRSHNQSSGRGLLSVSACDDERLESKASESQKAGEARLTGDVQLTVSNGNGAKYVLKSGRGKAGRAPSVEDLTSCKDSSNQSLIDKGSGEKCRQSVCVTETKTSSVQESLGMGRSVFLDEIGEVGMAPLSRTGRSDLPQPSTSSPVLPVSESLPALLPPSPAGHACDSAEEESQAAEATVVGKGKRLLQKSPNDIFSVRNSPKTTKTKRQDSRKMSQAKPCSETDGGKNLDVSESEENSEYSRIFPTSPVKDAKGDVMDTDNVTCAEGGNQASVSVSAPLADEPSTNLEQSTLPRFHDQEESKSDDKLVRRVRGRPRQSKNTKSASETSKTSKGRQKPADSSGEVLQLKKSLKNQSKSLNPQRSIKDWFTPKDAQPKQQAKSSPSQKTAVTKPAGRKRKAAVGKVYTEPVSASEDSNFSEISSSATSSAAVSPEKFGIRSSPRARKGNPRLDDFLLTRHLSKLRQVSPSKSPAADKAGSHSQSDSTPAKSCKRKATDGDREDEAEEHSGVAKVRRLLPFGTPEKRQDVDLGEVDGRKEGDEDELTQEERDMQLARQLQEQFDLADKLKLKVMRFKGSKDGYSLRRNMNKSESKSDSADT